MNIREYKKIYIEITNVCNLNCNFCPQTKRRPQYMGIDTFSNILDQVKGYGSYIYLHVKGEPLLHDDIDKLLDISFSKGFKVNITTNGTLLHKVKDKLIAKPALRQVNISLHSLDENASILEKEEYTNQVISFAKEAVDKSQVIIGLRLWNLDEDNEINVKRKLNHVILETIEKEFSLPYRIQEKLSPERGIKLADRIYLNQDYQFRWPDLNEGEDDGEGYCYGLRNQVAILVDGTVVPCCLDGEGVINLGNINTTSFSEIIHCNRAASIYEGFSNRKVAEELCRRCSYRRRW